MSTKLSELHDGHMLCLTAMPPESRRTLLVLDSGVGGLSIYNKIRQILPNLHYIYVFDNVAFPYGEKSEEFLVDRVVKILTLVQQRHPLALAVIACNTASTVSLPALREKFQFPIVGVVPAIKLAARLTTNRIVGLLATRGTLRHPNTHKLIECFANECQVEMLNAAELVALAEAKLHGKAVPLESLRRILQVWLGIPEPPDTVVLGCTHFPLLQDELLAVLPAGTRLVDSGAAIARRTLWLLAHEAPDIQSMETNTAYCMAFTPGTTQLLPVLRRYGFEILDNLAL